MLAYLEQSLLALVLVLLVQHSHQRQPGEPEAARSQLLDCRNSTAEPRADCPTGATAVATEGATREEPIGRRQTETGEVCSSGLAADWRLVCGPSNVSLDGQLEERRPGAIQVEIVGDSNELEVAAGASVLVQCKFNASKLAGEEEEVRFRLRWLRSVAESAGGNQSIWSTDTDSGGREASMIAAGGRVWTSERPGGLDLEVNEFGMADAGDYFCQASSPDGQLVLSEARVRLSLRAPPATPLQESHAGYSAANLARLLPSLVVVPRYLRVGAGEETRLACVTGRLDPDPNWSELEWSFERAEGAGPLEGPLPPNTSVQQNLLVVGGMGVEQVGVYKCRLRLAEFNLTAEATGELALRSQPDAAPLVLVWPELVRLEPGGGASLQCEATGEPAPALSWYRLEEGPLGELEGVEVEQVASKDAGAFCRQRRCRTPAGGPPVSAISLVRLRAARPAHQGQYVCQAANKHGSNQATGLLDVEFREPPQVVVEPAGELELLLAEGAAPPNATFRCRAERGRPAPRLRWLRPRRPASRPWSPEAGAADFYDLAQVSSASAQLSSWLEADGALVLSLGRVAPEDEGAYVCAAENEWGAHSAVGQLRVRRPVALRILQPSPLVAKPDQSFHLDCLATGHPAPLDLEWSRADRGAFFALTSRRTDAGERARLKFDRVTEADAGEYTCNARDPLAPATPLRATIQVQVGGPAGAPSAELARQLPALLVRPARVEAPPGANLTLDCLPVSGLQPALVEWVGPAANGSRPVGAFYRDGGAPAGGQPLQFGSRLRIANLSKAHEGVYQCRGRNRVGVESAPALVRLVEPQPAAQGEPKASTKTKVAQVGANIELRCQVSGVEEPATSWSRDGQQLPRASLQMGHHLWLQNVSLRDQGLYVCSARSRQHQRVLQARVRLLVQAGADGEPPGGRWPQLSARVVASKSKLAPGDSVTLECILGAANGSSRAPSPAELEELERQVVWTNAHSNLSVFQENVYVQENLLIVYELRPENSATYRCNFNQLSQHADFRLQLEEPAPPNRTLVRLEQVFAGASVALECPCADACNQTRWLAGGQPESRRPVGVPGRTLTLEGVTGRQADVYGCFQGGAGEPLASFLVQVLQPAARFVQGPAGAFVGLPGIGAASRQQLEVELKFLPERDSGLLLFSGPAGGRPAGDFVSMGLQRGHLEFRFELGDGETLLRSLQPVALFQWHRLLVERSQRGAAMWLDGQPVVSNSSPGNFQELNLHEHALLYVAGHEQLAGPNRRPFYGYARGFQGCVALLRVQGREIDLMAAANRSAALGLFECPRAECRPTDCGGPQRGLCQLDRGGPARSSEPQPGGGVFKPDTRCLCLPGLAGAACEQRQTLSQLKNGAMQGRTLTGARLPAGGAQPGSCEARPPCAPEGTLKCQSLAALGAFKCHCRIGWTGELCQRQAHFADQGAAFFGPQAYLQLRFQPASQVSLVEQLTVSFRLRTRSSYGLVFYTGQGARPEAVAAPDAEQQRGAGHHLQAGGGGGSLVASLLARATNHSGPADYLALALIDGYLELSAELGDGLASLRSSQKLNDDREHLVSLTRQRRLLQLTLDRSHKYETLAPGKLELLQTPADFYLAGLPSKLDELAANMYLSGFVGCLSHLEINSLGPLNLVRSDYLTELRAGRNLAPCKAPPPSSSAPPPPKPYAAPTGSPADADDPDEM